MKNKKLCKKAVSIILMIVLLIALAFPIYGASKGYSSKENEINKLIDKINSEMPRLLKAHNVQGASITVIQNGQAAWSQGFGYADKGKQIKATEDTIFQVASISKAVTAVGIMKLVEEGKLELDAPVEKYLTRWNLSDTSFNKENITVKSLLSHTAGLSVHGYAGYSPDKKTVDIVDSLNGKLAKAYKPEVIAEPGTSFMYSGAGFSILQLLVEEVTGLPFHEYMQQEVFSKLGMDNSFFEYSDEMKGKLSKAYGVFGQEMPSYVFAEKAAAGLLTTSSDLAKLCSSLTDNSINRLLKRETMDKMLTKTILKNGSESMYGLGFWILTMRDGSKAAFHGGDNRGWRSEMVFSPQTGDGIVILTNSYMGGHFIDEVSSIWGEYRFGSRPPYYIEDKNFERLIVILSSSAFVLLLLYSLKVLLDYKKGKRQFLFAKNYKKRVFAIVKISVLIIALTAWWFILFAPWYDGGWVPVAFLPLGFMFLTKMVTGCILLLMFITFLPRLKKPKNNSMGIEKAQ